MGKSIEFLPQKERELLVFPCVETVMFIANQSKGQKGTTIIIYWARRSACCYRAAPMPLCMVHLVIM